MKLSQKQKTLQIYDLATNIGYILIRQSDSKVITKIGNDLLDTGRKAIEQSRIKINNKLRIQIANKLNELWNDDDEFDTLEAATILFLGLSELVVKSGTKMYSNKLRKTTLKLLAELDPEVIMHGTYRAGFLRYDKWMDKGNFTFYERKEAA